LDRRERHPDIPGGSGAWPLLFVDEDCRAKHVQEVTFLRVGKFNSIALNLLAPGQDLFILSVYLVPVNGVHQELGLLAL